VDKTLVDTSFWYDSRIMDALYAIIPILLVLITMTVFRKGSALAGLVGWLSGLAIAMIFFGLNWQVFWVSQAKGLLLTFNVLLILWPALLLYSLVDQVGGIRAIAGALQELVPDKGWLAILQAWILTALIESLAGFGMPIAIVSPMLMALGVPPVIAVAVAAIGHTWTVSLGGMALPFRTLSEIVQIPQASLFPASALLLGITAVIVGLAVMLLLNEKKHWWRVLVLGMVIAAVQYLAGRFGLISICAFLAAITGIVVGVLLCPHPPGWKATRTITPALRGGLFAYGLLIVIIFLVSVIKPVNQFLSSFTWTLNFPQVVSNTGLTTAAGHGYLLHYLLHSGTMILLAIAMSLVVFRFIPGLKLPDVKLAVKSAFRGALPASLGTLFMIGLSTTMEHTGMTVALARGLSNLVGGVYPLFTPIVGMVGAFATGSNTNSNVLFGLLQKEMAGLIGVSPIVLLAAQTTGGALGSMIAPAKLAVGTSTNELKGREGEILRYTLPVGIVIALIIGLVTFLIR
jgi:lactate permease